MALMNDRWRFPVAAPAPPPAGQPCLCRVSRRTVAARARRPAYAPVMAVIEEDRERAEAEDLVAVGLSEEVRSTSAKALAFSYWLTGDRGHRTLARQALSTAGDGPWGPWCSSPDSLIDHLLAADLLRAAGAMGARDLADLRERLAPKLGEGFAIAPKLPQNNWRIEADCALGLAALLWWHDPGRWPVEEWLAAALDGLSRVLFGLLSPDGAYEEGPNYSRRAAIPFIRFAYAYLRLAGVDLLNLPALRNWHRWQVEVKRPDGRTMPFDDSHDGFEHYPHALLANPLYADAPVQRWAHDRAPVVWSLWAAEAMLLLDDRVKPRPPRGPASRVLDHSGTAIFRSGWGRDATLGMLLSRPLIPFGTDQVNTAHRHDDPLHFMIHAHGELLAGDPGYGPSYLDDRRYSWYLTPGAHNMILVDGEGPPRTTAFRGDCRKANVSQSDGRVEEVCRSRDVYGARAETSYCGVDFRRSMFFVRRRYFVLIDEITSPRTHEYAWALHGGSDDFAYRHDGGLWHVGDARLTARFLQPSGLAIWHGLGDGEAGAPRAYIQAYTAGRDVRYVTVLVPDKWNAAAPEVELVGRDPVAIRVRVARARRPDLFVWTPSGRGRVSVPGEGSFRADSVGAVFRLSV